MRTVTIPRSRVFHGPLAVVNRSHPLRGDIPTDLAAPDDRYPDILDVYKRQALDKAERLEDLINEFFDITRFNLSHLELEKRPVDLNRMLHQVVSEFQPMLAEKSMTCHLALPDKLSCSCDPDKLARVFDNLLRNACHYGLPGTDLSLIHI